MAIYKIFPEKTATLYSYYPTLNSGLDEILELSTFYTVNQTNDLSRILIKFPQDQINDVITNNVSGSTFDSYLKLSLANASELPLDYTIYSYPLSGSWNIGTGKLADSPITTDGASWKYKDNISNLISLTSDTSLNVNGEKYYYGNNVILTISGDFERCSLKFNPNTSSSRAGNFQSYLKNNEFRYFFIYDNLRIILIGTFWIIIYFSPFINTSNIGS